MCIYTEVSINGRAKHASMMLPTQESTLVGCHLVTGWGGGGGMGGTLVALDLIKYRRDSGVVQRTFSRKRIRRIVAPR